MKSNGATCILCDALVEQPEHELARPVDLGDCTRCGEIACVVPVWVSDCNLGRDCEHDDHHFGHTCHVKELDQ